MMCRVLAFYFCHLGQLFTRTILFFVPTISYLLYYSFLYTFVYKIVHFYNDYNVIYLPLGYSFLSEILGFSICINLINYSLPLTTEVTLLKV